MSENVSYEFLWEILQKERSSNALQFIPKNFYVDVLDFIESAKNKQPGELEAAAVSNMSRLINEIFEKRKQKIVLYVAYKKPLPMPAVEMELSFYNKLMDTYNNTLIAGQKQQAAESGKLRVVIEKLPEVFLPSGAKIGPLEKGQIIEIKDKTDTAFLIDNSLCVYEKL
ncbi:MAG: hypothetical protein M1544_01570 [Candidatus Marsarchaeota archaeon]|nr:hypothetical protein [Candidatus Marsarchaeota archaeon]